MVADSRPEPAQPQRSFIARFFIFLFKLIMLLVVIAGGIAMGTGAASWINLSNDTNNTQTKRLNEMQVEMVGVRQYEDQITSVSNKADFIDGVVGDVKDDVGAMSTELSDLSDAVASQAEMISAQQDQVTALTEAQAGILDDLAAAQVDVEELAQTADDIGVIVTAVSDDTASVDSALSTLQGQISALETSLADLESSVVLSGTVATVVAEEETAEDDGATVAADAAPVQVDLTLVRILGHIARAKIHLLENDVVSAGQAIEDATALSTDETLSSSLQDALDNLESKPAASAIALDEAWNALDALLDS